MSVAPAPLDTEGTDATGVNAAPPGSTAGHEDSGRVSPHFPDPHEARIAAFATDDHAKVVATITVFCGSGTDAGDAVVDALGRAWEHLAAGKTIDNLAAWVTRVAMNQIRSRHRHLAVVRRTRHLVARDDRSADVAEQRATRIDVERAVATLTRRQREVLALHYGLDLGIVEIATQLDIAEGTVKATLHQSRSKVADLLGADFRGTPDA